MIAPVIHPTQVALAISKANGYHLPRPQTALSWMPCPECARYALAGQQRMTVCKTCGGPGRLPILPA